MPILGGFIPTESLSWRGCWKVVLKLRCYLLDPDGTTDNWQCAAGPVKASDALTVSSLHNEQVCSDTLAWGGPCLVNTSQAPRARWRSWSWIPRLQRPGLSSARCRGATWGLGYMQVDGPAWYHILLGEFCFQRPLGCFSGVRGTAKSVALKWRGGGSFRVL